LAGVTSPAPKPPAPPAAFELRNLTVYFGQTTAVKDVSLSIPAKACLALIGPYGSGRSTVLRALNRTNDLIAGARTTGSVLFEGRDLSDPGLTRAELRRRIRWVGARPDTAPTSISANISEDPAVQALDSSDRSGAVEQGLRRANLWGEVKGRLSEPAMSLSADQRKRLSIARALATSPDVLLLDEPCRLVGPITCLAIEDLLIELRSELTVVIATHNMQQAARVSDKTAMFYLNNDPGPGRLIECDATSRIFTNPAMKQTEDYITGRFG
jgi:phosphate transport system ATP-binding protein